MRLATLINYSTIVVVLCVWSHQTHAIELDTLFKRKDQRALDLINDGQHEEAIELLDSGSLRGVSRYRSGDYENALEDFATGDDAVSLYNHGTAAARLGDYDTAVASLEKALELDPVNQLIKNNLHVARKLRDRDDDSSQENQQGENNQEESEDGESDDQQQNPESKSDSENTDSQQSNEQQNGELAESAKNSESQDAQQSEEQLEQAADAQDSSEEQRQAELEAELSESENDEEGEPMVAGSPEHVSENDQATQQWLRRIPDDGSQLLRNKIKLNKYLEYPEVQDQPEAW